MPTPTPTILTEDGLHQVNPDGFGTTFVGSDEPRRSAAGLSLLGFTPEGRGLSGTLNASQQAAVSSAVAQIERAFGREADASASGRAA